MDAVGAERRDPKEQDQVLSEWLRAVGQRKSLSRVGLVVAAACLALIGFNAIDAVQHANDIAASGFRIEDAQQHVEMRATVLAIISGITACLILTLACLRLARFTLARMFRRSMLDVTHSLPNGHTKTILHALIRRMGVDERRLRIWIDMQGRGSVPSMFWSPRYYHLVLPIAFTALMGRDRSLGGAVLAHELSHVVQDDVSMAVYTDSILKVIWRLYIPVQLLVLLPLSTLSNIASINHSRQEATSTFLLGARLGIPGEAVIVSPEQMVKASRLRQLAEVDALYALETGALTISTEVLLMLMLKRLRTRSEATADLASAAFVSGTALGRIFERTKPRSTLGKVIHFVEPSVRLRSKLYAQILGRYPSLRFDASLPSNEPWPYSKMVSRYVRTRLSLLDALSLAFICAFVPLAVGWSLLSGQLADDPIPFLWSAPIQFIVATAISVSGLAIPLLLMLRRRSALLIGYVLFPLYFCVQGWALYEIVALWSALGAIRPDIPFEQLAVTKVVFVALTIVFGFTFYASASAKLRDRLQTRRSRCREPV